MGKMTGKIALITGSDSGIGQAIADAFVREGADIVVTYHSDDTGASETAKLVTGEGRNVVVCQLDVRDQSNVAAALDHPEKKIGTPHILINNAGIGGSGEQVAESDPAAFERIIKTDLCGPYLCSREFIKRRQAAANGGKIVTVTSVHAAIPSPRNAGYDAAKGGLLTLVRSLALELAPAGINVNAIAPARSPATPVETAVSYRIHSSAPKHSLIPKKGTLTCS